MKVKNLSNVTLQTLGIVAIASGVMEFQATAVDFKLALIQVGVGVGLLVVRELLKRIEK